MSSYEHSAETTLAIILGAQEWPDCPNLPNMTQASTAARGFENYLKSGTGLNLPRENVLNLFDSHLTPSSMLMDARRFLLRRRKEILEGIGRATTDIFIYFAGHGETGQHNSTYTLFVRSTDATQPANTGLSTVNLAELIRTVANDLRCYVILDACYSGAAYEAFRNHPLNKCEEVSAMPTSPCRGVSLFCSSSGGAPSKALQNNAYPMFTGEFLEALSKGVANKGRRLSVREIAELTINGLRKKHKNLMVWPVVHSPFQFPGGDVANVPIFPNPAYIPETRKSEEIAIATAQESFVRDQPYFDTFPITTSTYVPLNTQEDILLRVEVDMSSSKQPRIDEGDATVISQLDKVEKKTTEAELLNNKSLSLPLIEAGLPRNKTEPKIQAVKQKSVSLLLPYFIAASLYLLTLCISTSTGILYPLSDGTESMTVTALSLCILTGVVANYLLKTKSDQWKKRTFVFSLIIMLISTVIYTNIRTKNTYYLVSNGFIGHVIVGDNNHPNSLQKDLRFYINEAGATTDELYPTTKELVENFPTLINGNDTSGIWTEESIKLSKNKLFFGFIVAITSASFCFFTGMDCLKPQFLRLIPALLRE